jgi:hypothetical protein
MMAHHQHIEMLIQGVERTGGICAARQDVRVFYHGDDVWCMTPTSALSVVCVNSAVFEGLGRLLNKPGLIESVGVDKTLDVIFVTYTEIHISGLGLISQE